MCIPQQCICVCVPHKALHPDHRIAHFQAPRREGMAERMEVERGIERFEQGLDVLARAIMVKGPLPIGIRTKDVSPPLPLSEDDGE